MGTLLMIGGVSQIEEPPRRPRDEALMAFLGPLTSLVIAGVLWAALFVVPRGTELWELRFGPTDRLRSFAADFVRPVRPPRTDSPVWEALQAMLQAGVPEIAVVSPEGEFLGTISRWDIERAVRLLSLQPSATEGSWSLRKRTA